MLDFFLCPYYVALTNDNTCMYVSDVDNHSVTILTLDGNVKSVYKEGTLEYPRGLCVDKSGIMFVTGGSCGTRTVHKLAPGTDKLQPLLDETDGLSNMPYSLVYSDREGKIYVGMVRGDVLKVFHLQ